MSSTFIEDVCSTCGKFVRRSNMARHLKAHTVKNFLCFYTSHIKKKTLTKEKNICIKTNKCQIKMHHMQWQPAQPTILLMLFKLL